MNNDLLLLTSINNRINQISFPTLDWNIKAKFLCYNIFTEFINDGSDFQTLKEIPIGWFKKIITRPATRSKILKELKNAGILIDTTYCTGSSVINGVVIKNDKEPYSKSYSFGQNYIYNSPIGFTQFKNINKTDDRVKFKQLNNTLKTVTVDPAVYNYIPELVESELSTTEIGSKITNKMITRELNKETITKPLVYWLKVATNKNSSLIKFNDKFYIEDEKGFIERKRIELEISYTYAIERIKNGNYYANRNDTNNRLDYNMTGLKKELFPYIILDGEKTKEIDIANAQFALLSNIPGWNLDDKFIEVAQNGTLYEYIAEKIAMTRDDVKKYMIVAAFGEPEYQPKELNNLFPNTMKSIVDFKNEFGYEQFSIMLQNAESNLMIDGVYNLLYKNNIKVLPVHDSMRVKSSDADMVKDMMENFFIKKEFKCALKNK